MISINVRRQIACYLIYSIGKSSLQMRLPKVTSLKELEALAVTLERRAATRFDLMASAMRACGRQDLSKLLEQLAREERRHEATIRAAAHGLDETLLNSRWPAKLGEAPSEPDANQLARASVYQCLAEAVRNEEKAFQFFSYLAANAGDGALKACAEDLAKEELSHAALLRRARRFAFHQQKRPLHGWPMGNKVRSLDDLRDAALARESTLRQRIKGLRLDASKAAVLDRTAAGIYEQLASGQTRQGDLPQSESSGVSMRSLEEEAAEAFEFYDMVVRSATDETVMLTAQHLAVLSLDRIKLLADAEQEPAQ